MAKMWKADATFSPLPRAQGMAAACGAKPSQLQVFPPSWRPQHGPGFNNNAVMSGWAAANDG
jgi:hypothetical protein